MFIAFTMVALFWLGIWFAKTGQERKFKICDDCGDYAEYSQYMDDFDNQGRTHYCHQCGNKI